MNSFMDIKGNADLQCGANVSFTYDRFCEVKSAIYINNGFLQVPPGVYFSGDFTLIAWINLKSYQTSSRIIDFGNGETADNVIFALANNNSNLVIDINSPDSNIIIVASSITLELNKWYHVATVLNGTNGYIYVNGKLATSSTLDVPRNVQRANNYIGKSNWYQDPKANAVYDELKLYQTALSEIFIMSDYTISSNNG